MPATRRSKVLGFSLLFATSLALVGVALSQPSLWQRAPQTDAPAAKPPTVVFIVLDTVRADHTSICGYKRPTTPNLQSLVDDGMTLVCDAYSPARWTVPSHASYFTGKEIFEHRTLRKGEVLSDTYATLAEEMTARGYQSLMVAANPNLGKASGMQRGFELARVAATHKGEYRARDFATKLGQMLGRVDDQRPLFLFVNIMDAHEPYPAIPERAGWLPPQPSEAKEVLPPNGSGYLYQQGLLTEEEEAQLRVAKHNGYDWGISHADQNVAVVLDQLTALGRLDNYRLIITSDHGEMLGEHQLLEHADQVYQGVVNVPFLYFDSAATTPLQLPTPMSAVTAFYLARDGQPPEQAIAPSAIDFKERGKVMNLAVWSGPYKSFRMGDHYYLFDVETDPEELKPTELGDHPTRALLEEYEEHYQAWIDEEQPVDRDAEMMELLKAAGYVE